jgi:hypothetical protein
LLSQRLAEVIGSFILTDMPTRATSCLKALRETVAPTAVAVNQRYQQKVQHRAKWCTQPSPHDVIISAVFKSVDELKSCDTLRKYCQHEPSRSTSIGRTSSAVYHSIVFKQAYARWCVADMQQLRSNSTCTVQRSTI